MDIGVGISGAIWLGSTIYIVSLLNRIARAVEGSLRTRTERTQTRDSAAGNRSGTRAPLLQVREVVPVDEMTPVPTFRLRPPVGWHKIPYCASCLESVPSAAMPLRSRLMLLPLLVGGLFLMPNSFRNLGLNIPTVPFVVVVTALTLLIMWRAEAARQPDVPYTLGISLGFKRIRNRPPLTPLKAVVAVVLGVVLLIVLIAVITALVDLFS